MIRRNPAPGFRGYDANYEGIARYVGFNGYSWSSAPRTDDITVQYLAFSAQYLYPSNTNGRTYGFQLRCLSE
ncbi:hypothetical protein [uncultured Rikenella sp.]|uniref:hypothetical protein n=1 Tax=uncultured Rikenella sp. TaxID=368003 RepID=UPI002627C589|nr:hypothetical protein [uncultured Rikenella sp.]